MTTNADNNLRCHRRRRLVLANRDLKLGPTTRYVHAHWLRPLVFTTVVASAAPVSAQEMPWEQAMNQIQQALTGPFAKAVCVILICLCGIGFAASEGGGMLRKAVWGVVGLTIALNAARFVAVFGGT
jgi:type IV secretion system protein VirB2